MNKFSRMVLALGLLLAGMSAADAQITVNAADFAAQLKPGSVILYNFDSTLTSINVGGSGSQTWDFSALGSKSHLKLVSIDKAKSKYAAGFPNSTHVFAVDSATLAFQGTVVSGNAEYFWRVTNGVYDMGLAGHISSPLIADVRYPNTPADTMFAFPLTVGTGWGSHGLDTLYVGSLPFANGSFAKVFKVNGYGKMTLPGGATYDALRIRRYDGTGTFIYGYQFLAANGAMVSFSVSDPAHADSGVVAAKLGIQWSPAISVPTAVEQAGGAVPAAFSLSQNYPNPFNPTTVISYTIPKQSNVTLTVFNMLGQEVATLVNGMMPAGSHSAQFSAQNLSSGVYFYRLTAGDFVSTRKMTLVK